MDKLRLTSCMAPTMDPMVAALAECLSSQLELRIEPLLDRNWRIRDAMVRRGEVDLFWICGLPYVWMADGGDPVELLAAPVMSGARYGGEPVYFSDIVVAESSVIRSSEHLKGTRWAYNEPGSHSGYNSARVWLARNGLAWDDFREVWEAGTHVRALRWIMGGRVDVAAIDTTVLDWELKRRPELTREIRRIDTVGPSPIPPWVALRSVPTEVRWAIKDALMTLKDGPMGREILSEFGLSGFVQIEDGNYDPIRDWDERASSVGTPPASIFKAITPLGRSR